MYLKLFYQSIIQVQCLPGFDGGLDQSFLLEVIDNQTASMITLRDIIILILMREVHIIPYKWEYETFINIFEGHCFYALKISGHKCEI